MYKTSKHIHFAMRSYLLLFLFSSCSNDDNSNTISLEELDSVLDIDGNSYKTIKIGSQIWMAENLKTEKYNDGKIIRFDDFINDTLKQYGRHYYRDCVNSPKIAPKGWRVASKNDWNTLISYLKKNGYNTNEKLINGLKSTSGWQNGNNGNNGNNSTGFNMMPLGIVSFWNPEHELTYGYTAGFGIPGATSKDIHPAAILDSQGIFKISEEKGRNIFKYPIRCIKE